METLLYLTSNAIRIYAISIYIDTFLGKSKLTENLKKLTYILYYALGSFCWLFTHNPTLNIIINIVPVFLITIQYSTSWKKRLFATLTSCTMGMFIEWIAFTLLGSNQSTETGFIQYNIMLILSVVFKHIYINKSDYSIKSKYSWFLCLIAVGTIIVGVLTLNDESPHDYLIAIVLLLINLLNFYVYNLEQSNLEKQHVYELISNANNAYQNQLQIMFESQKKLKFMRHDLKKHLIQIRTLINNGNYQELPSYLDAMEEAVIVKKEYSKTGNKDVDSLINYELTLASEFGTEIICDIELPEQLNITSFDMTIILGNLLDNAIEALRQSKKKLIIITIKYMKGIIRIDIENTYDSNYKRKPDGREHGIGLLSVMNTLEKYHGNLKTFPEDNRYHTTVVLFNSF